MMKRKFNVKKLRKTFNEAERLGVKKNGDYSEVGGPDNIGDIGVNGLSVRLYDKVCRLYNLTHSRKKPNFESLRDTCIDIVNYGAYAVMILDGEW